MSLLSAQEVMAIIPNRYPIFFIDKVEELTPGEHIVCYKNVTINEPFFQGHFPGEPVMPGVLIVEALAQAGSIPLLTLPDFEGQTAYLGGLNKVKFRQKVVPGDVLRLQVDIIKLKKFAGIGYGQAFVGDKKVCEVEMTFIIGR
ncbi:MULTISPECIES: 3-hydroxyacyl-ACP dehydratase FabZ [Trichococcus]|jgi:3-hydroxyacyl-[acyl-carrier-protein] dehydratase|uniref:3-hydroxyacyl-[acyl-carrier-protein] dehydratase FabZ n=2 Tax=Trichococcus TaxID=82802 RepID=A0A2T5IKF2_9LACT|nr:MULTISPECIES: 3-hydroxyacyl-ACP dehydratase FabZ [Trichococcus]MDB6352015.1 3-hydroxyacyl-ACP dehydratase FabZ [Trichococcus sp. K1Tr]PTQ84305.1 3-hydroxyacyl-[acyl-carrier-protein] dehydratase [Trichococcus patagoniensis]CZQ80670.1 beta-hydroxydecanoyl thiol ester dehydrase faba/fabz [Trichococcus collinsii]SDZ92178.1 3-hydroxyacyl-[acyl-carrier-protein] dehydratase [Trichococcus collinsii]